MGVLDAFGLPGRPGGVTQPRAVVAGELWPVELGGVIADERLVVRPGSKSASGTESASPMTTNCPTVEKESGSSAAALASVSASDGSTNSNSLPAFRTMYWSVRRATAG